MYTDVQYRRRCVRECGAEPSFPGLATDAPVGRVEDWPDRTNAGAFVVDRAGVGHYVLDSEVELDLMLAD